MKIFFCFLALAFSSVQSFAEHLNEPIGLKDLNTILQNQPAFQANIKITMSAGGQSMIQELNLARNGIKSRYTYLKMPLMPEVVGLTLINTGKETFIIEKNGKTRKETGEYNGENIYPMSALIIPETDFQETSSARWIESKKIASFNVKVVEVTHKNPDGGASILKITIGMSKGVANLVFKEELREGTGKEAVSMIGEINTKTLKLTAPESLFQVKK